MKDTYIEKALIRLYRKYSKDELVSALGNKLSETQKELTEAKDTIEYLEDEVFRTSLKNGGELWFNKWKKLKERNDELEKYLREIRKLNKDRKQIFGRKEN